MTLLKQLKTAIFLLIMLTILTGFIYPLVVTTLAQVLFPWQANGSLVEHNGKTIGSLLIGQYFTQSAYLWGRPSATTPFPYNAENSSASNLGPSNPIFLNGVKAYVVHLSQGYPKNTTAIPVDLVEASGSGLDPDISPYAALYQAKRIATARGIDVASVEKLIFQSIKRKTLGLLGEPRVNVLELNLALDATHFKEGIHSGTTP